MKKKLLFCLAAIVMLTGCSSNIHSESRQGLETAGRTVQRDTTYQSIWDQYAAQNGNKVEDLIGIPQEPDLFPLYMEGLKHKSPLIRWYAVNRCLEFASEKNKAALDEEISKLQNDSDQKVKTAAAFVLSAIDKKFEGERFVKTKDGARVAFHRYQEAAYNDGNIWVSMDDVVGSWCMYTVGGSIIKLDWSPDGRKLAVEHGGRTWQFISIIDMEDGQVKDIGLFSQVLKEHVKLGYPQIKNPRPDPQVTLLEWSPDSGKMLLFYSFRDDQYKQQSGTAIYDVNKERFDSIKPYPTESDEGQAPHKPDGFKWK